MIATNVHCMTIALTVCRSLDVHLASGPTRKEAARMAINWNYCNNPNEINNAIRSHDEISWDGLTEDNIISITWDANQGCYVVFWRVDDGN